MAKKKETKKFHKRLALNSYLLSKIGMQNFEEIQSSFRIPELEEIDNEGRTKYIEQLIFRYADKFELNKEELLEYDDNIVKALNNINEKRSRKITLKYYQYFSLLFVEIYLDRYFANKDDFLEELNNYLALFDKENDDDLAEFTKDDINKLALWGATGSGKTILMHINYYQILHYLKKYNKNYDGSFILLTPNEGLSDQHIKEFKEDGIKATIYNKQMAKLFNGNSVGIDVIENTKLAEKDGDKTVATSRFGHENIIFVDEGHRGTSGNTWHRYRNELCENGFSFEYSATFGQAIRASTSGSKELEEEYAKCIYFDYSYRHFYNDGFGKDYQILNLDNDEDNIRTLYLTASLLTFYQQKRLFKDNSNDYKDFNIENPLMIFVGGSVNAVRTVKKQSVSDVVEMLMFLNEFTDKRDKYIDFIKRILEENTGILNSSNVDVFRGNFDYLNKLKMSATEVYQDMLLEIFHENIPGSILHIENLKGADGEIRLRLGENKPFGLINVGDTGSLIKLCSSNNLNTGEVDFSESLFGEINSNESSINILIGSKKFTEGWNSWRVSSMGLMNIGKSEGSQIIQLFGRGIRLKGKNMTLKRSSAYFVDYPYEHTPTNYKYLKYLETLNVFGVKADYMAQFKEYLEAEGLNVDEKPWTVEIPIIRNKPENKVMTLKVKDNLDFKKDGKSIIPGEKSDTFMITLDCYGKVQFQSSSKTSGNKIEKDLNNFKQIHLALLDYDYIYFEIQKYKGEKNYYNFAMTKKMVKNLLSDVSWYKIQISDEDIEIKSMEDISRFNRIAIALLKKYMDKKYTVSRASWESPLLKYEYIDDNDPNFVKNDLYSVEVNEKERNDSYINFLTGLKEEIEDFIKNKAPLDIRKVQGDLGAIGLNESLYNPYLYLAKTNLDIKIKPVALNESEWEFINELKKYLKDNEDKYKDYDIYVIRNASKKGVGFFENNGFYPDFILWIINDEECHMVFVEPHGMGQEDINSEKVQLHRKIKEYEGKIDSKEIKGSSPILDSFILSPTKRLDITSSHYSEQEWNKNHVFFMDTNDYVGKIFDTILK